MRAARKSYLSALALICAASPQCRGAERDGCLFARADSANTGNSAKRVDGSAAAAPSSVAASGGTQSSRRIVVRFSDRHQTIEGFGAADVWNRPYSSALLDLYFCGNATDPGCARQGIGLSLLRTRVDTNGDPGNQSDLPESASEARATIQGASARGARVWVAPWEVATCPQGTHLASANYAIWAATIVRFAREAAARGVPIFAISVQNEPDYNANDSCFYTDAEMAAFVRVLGRIVNTLDAGAKPKIIAPETSSWDNLWPFVEAIKKDPVADGYIGAYATHQYSGKVQYKPMDRSLWETEFSTQDKFDPNIGNAVTVAHAIHAALVDGNVSAWHYWWLQGINEDNEGLLGFKQDPGARTKRLYAMGNFSRFVRPGWVRLGADSSMNGLLVSAFANPGSGDFAIVAINTTGGNVSASFELESAKVSSVTPYVTSGTPLGEIGTEGNLSLGSTTAGVPSAIAASKNAFATSIPYGITTFVGNAR